MCGIKPCYCLPDHDADGETDPWFYKYFDVYWLNPNPSRLARGGEHTSMPVARCPQAWAISSRSSATTNRRSKSYPPG